MISLFKGLPMYRYLLIFHFFEHVLKGPYADGHKPRVPFAPQAIKVGMGPCPPDAYVQECLSSDVDKDVLQGAGL
jgi:hypothetical protein